MGEHHGTKDLLIRKLSIYLYNTAIEVYWVGLFRREKPSLSGLKAGKNETTQTMVRNLQCDIRLHIRLDIRVLVYTFGGFWFGVAK